MKFNTLFHYLYSSSLIPIYIYQGKELQHAFPNQDKDTHPPAEYVDQLLETNNTVTYLSTSFFSYFGALKVNELSNVVIIIGPISQINYSKDTFRSMKREYVVSNEKKEHFHAFFNLIPPMQLQQFINHLRLLHFLINNTEIRFTDIFRLKTEYSSINAQYATNVFEKKEHNYFNNSYDIEAQMLKNVENGNETGLLNFIEQPFIVHEGVIGPNNIRQAKNTYIVTLTLITRAAIRGGLETEVAFQLSDLYIQQIETLNTLEGIQTLCQEALFHFTKKVAEVRFNASQDEDVYKIAQYVYRHTNKPITVTEIADHFGYSRTYLSYKFKKDVGITLGQFITQCKLEEAKSLLTCTRKSISEISNYLCFSSQSHFQTIFKKYCKTTPASFRKQNKT